ncbi:MAG: glycogen synthase [Armatimonadetes bacterium]|nr:glycogen synthase [Armatimonadota bacterium]
MKVLMISFEVAPFSKVGGLADVAGSLPKALAERGVDIRVVTPKHRSVLEGNFELERILEPVYVPMPGYMSGCAVEQSFIPGTEVPVYFVEHDLYFNRQSIYGTGGGYGDQFERLAFFSRAALAAIEGLEWQPDVLHLNDYHTTLAAAYTRLWGLPHGTLFTGHNLGPGYQGAFAWDQIGKAGLDLGDKRVAASLYDGQINLARLGFVYCDLINAVSKGYAREIQTPEFGAGVDDLAQARAEDVKGIVNGIDYDVWNPGTDKSLPANFTAEDLSGKAKCKAAAQREFGLPVAPDVPLITMVTRLDAQKGLDLLEGVAASLEGVQLAILGTGDPRYEKSFGDLAARNPNIGVKLMFSGQLAKLLYAGGDMFLMPSRYEPCGLGQMIALAYANIPIVRVTGGLADTIKEKGRKPNGFRFEAYEAAEMVAAIERAVAAYHDAERWAQLRQNAFASDFSWDASAKQYISLYKQAAARAAGQARP